MKKLLTSLSIIAAVAVVVVGATGAFFSDTETSKGNSFTAGAIDLLVDSEAHYNGMVCVWSDTVYYNGDLMDSGYYWLDEDKDPANQVETAYAYIGGECSGSWEETNIGGVNQPTYKFFDYEDLKPGDWGENTISLHVENNDVSIPRNTEL